MRSWWVRVLTAALAGTVVWGVTSPAEATPAPEVPVVTTTLTGTGTVTRTEVSPLSGGTMLASCVESFCLAADSKGHYVTFDGATWSAPALFDPLAAMPSVPSLSYADLTSVSCASPTFCMLVDSGANVFLFDGEGVQPSEQGEMRGADLASCPEPGVCLVGGAAVTMRYDHGVWSELAGWTDAWADGFECGSPTFCVAASAGQVAVFDGTGWSATERLGTSNLTSSTGIDCVGPATCLAMTNTGEYSYSQGAWVRIGASSRPDGDRSESTFTCRSAEACLDTADGGVAVQATGAWSVVPLPAGISRAAALECGAGVCVAIDTVGRASWTTPSGWHDAAMVNPAGGRLTAIDCASASSCAVVGGNGQFARMTGGVWAPATMAAPTSWFTDVSCPTADFCMAVGYDWQGLTGESAGKAVAIRATTWSSVPVPVALTTVSCASASFCLGYNSTGFWAWRAGVWSQVAAPAPPVGTGNGWWRFSSLSCVSSTACILGNQVFDGGRWRELAAWPEAATGYPTYVDCQSPASCQAMTGVRSGGGTSAAMTTFDGRGWTSPVAITTPANWSTQGFSCAGAGRCAIARGDGGGGVFTNVTESASLAHAAEFGTLETLDVDCPSVTDCLFLTATGVTRWRGSAPSGPIVAPARRAPVFLVQQKNRKVKIGRKVTLAVKVSGTPAPVVRWQVSKNRGRTWTTIRTGSSVSIKVSKATGRRVYRAVATNAVGRAVSRTVKVTPRKR
jgi:hypothetical protein